MRVLYVCLGSKVSPRTFGYITMGSVVLFILSSILLLYSEGSEVNRVQVILSGLLKLLCFLQGRPLWKYVFLGCTRVCDVI